jgi:hypothetical protein
MLEMTEDARLAAPASVPPARARSTWQQISRRPALLCWCLFILLSPLYIFPVGMPQPADMLLFLLAPLALAGWDKKLDRSAARTVRALVWFTIWVAIVNYTWAVVLWTATRRDFVVHPLYYIFNLLMFVVAIVIARPDRRLFLRATVVLAFVTIVVQVLASFVYRTKLYRGTVFFENPNQLGYYALLCACVFAMTQKAAGLSRMLPGIGITLCAYLATLSGSRSALAGILVLLFVLVFSNPRTIIIATLVGLAMIAIGTPLWKVIDRAEQRAIQGRNPKMSFAEERGYDRIWHYPQHLVIGAGEGAYVRFEKEGEHRRELHSAIGTIIFGYGILGVTLFTLFLVRVLRGSALRNAAMMGPVLLYMLAHQGLRSPILWVVIAVFVVVKQTAPPMSRAERAIQV